MRERCRYLGVTASLVVLTALPAVGQAFGGDPAARAQRVAEITAELACNWEGLAVPDECGLESFERTEISGSVVEYTFGLRVGSGEYDKLTLHRVVKERRPYRPKSRPKGIMLLHGDVWGFTGAFMSAIGSGVAPDERALPVYLANNRVDAWGVTLRWPAVPFDALDPDAIMQDWDLQTDIDDLGIALQFMRLSRLFTGSGPQKVALLGWSRGGITGYAYLNEESQEPPALRNVDAFIPADIYAKTDDESLRQNWCHTAESTASQIEQGSFVANVSLFGYIGSLAVIDPDGPSPVIPGFTNGQVVVIYAGFPQNFASPWYHFFGSDLSAGFPTSLFFAEEPLVYAHFGLGSSYQPRKQNLEGAVMICDEEESPFDDHLADITVPVLYLGADGGVGEFGFYSTTLLGSDDVTTLNVDLSDVNAEDFGHSDLFYATDAETLVWAPLLDWLRSR